MTDEELRRYSTFLSTFKGVTSAALLRSINNHLGTGIKHSGGVKKIADEWARLDAITILGKPALCSYSIEDIIAAVEVDRQERLVSSHSGNRTRAAQQPRVYSARDPELPAHRFLRDRERDAILALARHARATDAPDLRGNQSALARHVAEVQKLLGPEIKI